jgi:hypothetical protein
MHFQLLTKRAAREQGRLPGMALAHSTISLLDSAWARTRGRIESLTDDEYLWEPVAGCWSARPQGARWIVDLAIPAPEPPPVTTIAWRTWHIGSDCINGINVRLFNVHASDIDQREWFGTAALALDALDVVWNVFAARAHELDDAAMNRELGAAWGPFARSNHADLLLHVADELIHHGAEIALLRDLFARRDTL